MVIHNREVNMPFFKQAPITNISFCGSTYAELTASSEANADFVRRVLRVLFLTSGKDGEKRLDLSVETTEEDLKIIATGNDMLSVLKKLSNSKPPTFNSNSVKKINQMCQQYLHVSPDVKSEQVPLLSRKG